MMKKSVLVKSFGSAFVAAAVTGVFVYSPAQTNVKRIDISAFSNLAANINTISTVNAAEPVLRSETDVNAIIVAQVENELKIKIKASRNLVKKAAANKVKINKVIAKNWNDIKPEFKAIAYDSVKVVMPQEQSSALINNQDLVKLYSFQSETVTYNAFANLSIETIQDDSTIIADIKDVVKDEVVHTMASTEVVNEKATAEDMVMFDYSKADTKETGRIFDAPLSSSVKRAIARELHKSPAALINSMNTQNKIQAPAAKAPSLDDDSLKDIMDNEDNIVYDYSQEKASAIKKDTAASLASAFAASIDNQAVEKEFTIKAREINLNTQKVRQAVGYEFVPDYDRAERMDDGAAGEIKVGYSLSEEMNTQTGIIQAQGMIPTRVELNLADGGMTIPLLNEAGIQKLLMKKQMDIQGNLAMVAIDPSVKDVELDSTYEAKMFFDNNFKQVDTLEASNYVLFLGVQTGNTLIKYLLDNKESAQKIIYIGDGEMYFEDVDFETSERELYTFTTRTLLGKKSKELNIEAGLVGIFGTKTTSKKKALNAYELKIPEMVKGSRKYLEFKHMPATLYVGTDKEKDIEVPGMDFIRRVLQANDMDELGQRCIVQINLTKDLRDIKVSGKNKAGEMFTETSYLDADGNFTRDSSELAEKVFVVGDMEGQFGAKLEYSDGSTQFLKTYCSEGSYLIEQL